MQKNKIMKATELRIGNYINDYYKGIIIISIDTLIGIQKCHDNRKQFQNIFAPIPLTEDWLKKFGFKEKAEYIWIKEIFKGMFDIKIILTEKGKYVPVIMSMGEEVAIRQKQYVHQLQNLYFTLTEKELKL